MIQKSYIAAILLIALSLAGCRPEEPEILNMSDILPESERYGEGNEGNDDIEDLDSMAQLKYMFISNGVDISDAFKIDNRLFPDRFGPESSEKYKLCYKGDTLLYYKWVYKDSVKVMNALYNWIDCFGDKCKSIYVNQNVNMQRNPMKIMVSDTSLIFIESQLAIDFKLWDDFHEKMGCKNDWNMIIEQGKGAKARWFTYKDDKKIPLEK